MAFSLLGLGVILGLLFYIVFDASKATIIESSERIRDQASGEIAMRVENFLARAPEIVRQFQDQTARGLVDPHDPLPTASTLFAQLLADADIGEITFTFAEKTGFGADGSLQVAATPRGQVTVGRLLGADNQEHLCGRYIHQENGGFVSERWDLDAGGNFRSTQPQRETGNALEDPTNHLTFLTPASKDFFGQLLWSDLHWLQLDSALPESKRRAEVSVQRVIQTAGGQFAGVLRVGLLTRQLDTAVRKKFVSAKADDPHRVFICDNEGRLITRISPADVLVSIKNDLRIAPAHLPAVITTALRDPIIQDVEPGQPSRFGHFKIDGEEYLTTFRALPDTQDWIVGIVVPRSYYLGRLSTMRSRLLGVSLAVILFVATGSSIVFRGIRRAQIRIIRESGKMKSFDFSPGSADSAFHDVGEVLEGLEKAKTAIRAMGKYAPIELVRRLYHENSEPVLGGEPMEISILFTDIKDFTSYSEQLDPNELATALGRYLEVMARIIQRETRGTIDKYIGDAIMALWNAPEPVSDHERMACEAALRCKEAGEALAKAPEWEGLPRFETRFGLHCETALVGHFGAPDRMNYTAIGDAVNLASRLEGLNKLYGTAIIVSRNIADRACDHFDFRLLDRVAVKGKVNAIEIYELLGSKCQGLRTEAVLAYETAFAAYAAGDFARAIPILEAHREDPPSAVLLRRCRDFMEDPPPADWGGVYSVSSK